MEGLEFLINDGGNCVNVTYYRYYILKIYTASFMQLCVLFIELFYGLLCVLSFDGWHGVSIASDLLSLKFDLHL